MTGRDLLSLTDAARAEAEMLADLAAGPGYDPAAEARSEPLVAVPGTEGRVMLRPAYLRRDGSQLARLMADRAGRGWWSQ